MTSQKYLGARLSRRSWVALAISGLSGCGGGSDTAGLPGTGGTGNTAGLPGTGGTGIYVQGSISGFGSVILNGIKFDDTQASANGFVQVDGVATTSADLRLGMVAALRGERSAMDATLGTASSIEVWSAARGVVTFVSTVTTGEFAVAGMTVQTNSNTVFDGVNVSAPLVVGMSVAVWGLQVGADGVTWVATRVAVVPNTVCVSSGLVSKQDAAYYVNNMLLTGSLVAGLTVNTMVRVQGIYTLNSNRLEVSNLKLLTLSNTSLPEGEIEIEGFVTQVLSTSRFMLGSIEVDHAGAFNKPLSSVVTVGDRVEVYGSWQSSLLVATEVEFEDEQTLHEVEIDAAIESFAGVDNFVVRGQRCNAANARFSNGTSANLGVGVKVKVKGAKAGDVLMVAELEFDH